MADITLSTKVEKKRGFWGKLVKYTALLVAVVLVGFVAFHTGVAVDPTTGTANLQFQYREAGENAAVATGAAGAALGEGLGAIGSTVGEVYQNWTQDTPETVPASQ